MHPLTMSLLYLATNILGSAISGPPVGIPTRQEQVELLLNVQEIFEHMQKMVDEEGRTTDLSVISDVEKIVKRAQDRLALIEELALIKLKCSGTENSVQIETSTKQDIQKSIQEGYTKLELCTQKVSNDIHTSSSKVSDVAAAATSHGQTVIDTLSDCAKKPGFQQISCYRRIMTNDVFPLKVMILQAMESHKMGHLKSAEIRNGANNCVDEIMEYYSGKIANILTNAIQR